MAGSLRQRGKTSWQLRVLAGRDEITGKKSYVSKTFRGGRREAERELARLVAEVEAGKAELESEEKLIDYREQNAKAGYVYVISNVGAFGPNIFKIVLTRRLEPLDRVRELCDASVPFPYDVHALYFSDDAGTLENELHKAFADRRVNFVNERREFFFATPTQVREILEAKTGGLLEYSEAPEALEYFQSRGRWPALPPPSPTA